MGSLLGRMPTEHGAVVVLANREVDDIRGMTSPLLDVLGSS